MDRNEEARKKMQLKMNSTCQYPLCKEKVFMMVTMPVYEEHTKEDGHKVLQRGTNELKDIGIPVSLCFKHFIYAEKGLFCTVVDDHDLNKARLEGPFRDIDVFERIIDANKTIYDMKMKEDNKVKK